MKATAVTQGESFASVARQKPQAKQPPKAGHPPERPGPSREKKGPLPARNGTP